MGMLLCVNWPHRLSGKTLRRLGKALVARKSLCRVDFHATGGN
jgi:hypothetical protein